MPVKKQKIIYRYRDRPAPRVQVTGPVSVETKAVSVFSRVREFQQMLITLGSVAAAAWIFLGPYVNAQADSLLRDKLVQIGMDPANIQQLNKNLEELQQKGEERAQKVDDLKSAVDKILIIIEQQQRQVIPYPQQMQAAPPPMPIQPAQ